MTDRDGFALVLAFRRGKEFKSGSLRPCAGSAFLPRQGNACRGPLSPDPETRRSKSKHEPQRESGTQERRPPKETSLWLRRRLSRIQPHNPAGCAQPAQQGFLLDSGGSARSPNARLECLSNGPMQPSGPFAAYSAPVHPSDHCGRKRLWRVQRLIPVENAKADPLPADPECLAAVSGRSGFAGWAQRTCRSAR